MTEKRKGRYGQGRVFKRGRIWWIRYHRDGGRFEESSRSTREADAKRLLNTRLGEIHAGTFVSPVRTITLEDGAKMIRADYIAQGRRSLGRVERSLKHVRAHFGTKRALATITAQDLDCYVTERIERDGAARATVKNELAALKRIFSLAIRKRLLQQRPAFPEFGDPDGNARKEFIEADDYAAIQAVIASDTIMMKRVPYSREYHETAARVITFVYRSGWRWKSEVRFLRWSQVDLDDKRVTLKTSKNGKGRVLAHGDDSELTVVIETAHAYTKEVEQRTGQPVEWVFHVNGKRLRADTEPGGFYHFWKAVCTKANVIGDDGRPKILHDHRRSTVRRLERAGVSREIAKRVVGHQTDSMYSRYNIVRDEDVQEAIGKAAEYEEARR